MSFRSLGLTAELAHAVADKGYDEPTPIQRQAIPVILAGRDLMAGAQTGTGKTAGFTLPLLQLLEESAQLERGPHSRSGRRPVPVLRALILTPTRELCAQVEASVKAYGKHLPLRSTTVFGGVGIVPQIKALKGGVDIVVATPGRLLDHLSQKTVDLSRVEILVLDEADRMLDMGFIRDIRKILAVLPRDRQNLLFSATFPEEIRRLADGFLKDPAVIQVTPSGAPPDLVSQVIHPVDRHRKRDLLAHLIQEGRWKQVLVFTRTKHGANRLAGQLADDGITTLAIHGNKSQGARTKALGDFKRGSIRVLVATDIAARGLDIDQLPHVVNYELPHVPEDYVHRIGRTGRAGKDGTAVSLVSAEEHDLLRGIERLLRRPVPMEPVVGFEPSGRVEPAPRERGSAGGSRGPSRGSRGPSRGARGPSRGSRGTPRGTVRGSGRGTGPEDRREDRGEDRRDRREDRRGEGASHGAPSSASGSRGHAPSSSRGASRPSRGGGGSPRHGGGRRSPDSARSHETAHDATQQHGSARSHDTTRVSAVASSEPATGRPPRRSAPSRSKRRR